MFVNKTPNTAWKCLFRTEMMLKILGTEMRNFMIAIRTKNK